MNFLVNKYCNYSINDFVCDFFTCIFEYLKKNKDEKALMEFVIEYEKVLKGITLTYTYDIHITSLVSVTKSYL